MLFMSIKVLRALNEDFIYNSESDMRAFRNILKRMLTCDDKKCLMAIEFDTVINSDLVKKLQKVRAVRISEIEDLKYEEAIREREAKVGLKLNHHKVSNEFL